jgi:hypothetical protein
MTPEIILLCFSAVAIAFVHTILGPDHYLPFVAMAKAREWSLAKTVQITLLCGLGHLIGSVVLGLIGIAMGSGLASLELLEGINDKKITFLESAIDRLDSLLPPLKGFILPNGNLAAAYSHLARTVCRRAERHVVRLSAQAPLGSKPKHLGTVLKYLNRLSDYLFVLARYCNHTLDRRDSVWETSRRVSNPDNIK